MEQLTRPAGTLAYDDTGGDGPLVVCVPGMGDLRAEYRFVAPALASQGYRVITTDVRGHGQSSVGWPDYSPAAVGSDVVAMIRHLNAGPAVVIGESMAAASAVWAAAEAPGDVAGIVLCGPATRDLKVNAFARLALGAVGRFPLLWTIFYASLYRSRKPADFSGYRRDLRANLGEPGRMAALSGMLTASKRECTERLPEVRCPALIVMGTRDPDFPDPAAEAGWLAGQLPDARVLMVDGAGHYPHAERPDEVRPALDEFLGRVHRA